MHDRNKVSSSCKKVPEKIEGQKIKTVHAGYLGSLENASFATAQRKKSVFRSVFHLSIGFHLSDNLNLITIAFCK